MPLILYSLCKQKPDHIPTGAWGESITFREVAHFYVGFSEIDSLKKVEGINHLSSHPIQQHPAILFQDISTKLHKQVDSLPIRFGTIAEDWNQLKDVIVHNRVKLWSQMNQFGHCIEHSLLFGIAKEDKKEKKEEKWKQLDSPGISYLKDKYENRKTSLKDDFLSQKIITTLSDCYFSTMLESKTEVTPTHIKVHILSHKDWFPNTVSLSDLQNALPVTNIHYIGCFPPFHFIHTTLSKV